MPMDSRQIFFTSLSIVGLFAVRYFETELFYDPLKSFFEGPYQSDALPDIHWTKWVINLIARYTINMFLSIVLLNAVFSEPSVIQFSAILYLMLLLILLPGLLVLMHHYTPGEYRPLFYIRRFVIHPILLLLLIPSFLMHNQKKKA